MGPRAGTERKEEEEQRTMTLTVEHFENMCANVYTCVSLVGGRGGGAEFALSSLSCLCVFASFVHA